MLIVMNGRQGIHTIDSLLMRADHTLYEVRNVRKRTDDKMKLDSHYIERAQL